MGRAALREAVAGFEQALDALEHVAITPEHLDRGIDVRLSLRNALYMLGEHERVLEHLRHAERLATARGERRRLVRVLGYLSTHFVFTEAFDDALTYGVRALSLARELGDGELEIEMAGRVALVHVFGGDYAQTVERLRDLLPRVIEELPSPRFFGVILTVVMVMSPLAQALAERGEFDEALRLALEAIRRAEQLDPRYSLAGACLIAGRVHLRRGDLGAATRLLERSVDIARAVNAATVLSLAASHLGLVYALAGRDSDAQPLLAEAVDKGAHSWEQSLHLVMLAEGHFLAGRMTQAHEVAERAFRRAREHRERGSEAWAMRLLGEIALRCEESAAEQHFHGALALATELGMRPLVAHCHLGLGKLCRRTGDHPKAQEHLTTAATMYREMGMAYWLEQAEAERDGA